MVELFVVFMVAMWILYQWWVPYLCVLWMFVSLFYQLIWALRTAVVTSSKYTFVAHFLIHSLCVACQRYVGQHPESLGYYAAHSMCSLLLYVLCISHFISSRFLAKDPMEFGAFNGSGESRDGRQCPVGFSARGPAHFSKGGQAKGGITQYNRPAVNGFPDSAGRHEGSPQQSNMTDWHWVNDQEGGGGNYDRQNNHNSSQSTRQQSNNQWVNKVCCELCLMLSNFCVFKHITLFYWDR